MPTNPVLYGCTDWQAGDVTLQFGNAHMAEKPDSEERDQAGHCGVEFSGLTIHCKSLQIQFMYDVCVIPDYHTFSW